MRALLLGVVVACGGGDSPALDAAIDGAVDAAPDAANRAPTAVDAAVTVDEDRTLTFPLPGTDPDGDPLTWTWDPPAHGVLSGAAPLVTYTPAADYAGDDAVVVRVSDGQATAMATVAITVRPVDDAPDAVDDTAVMEEDTTLALTAATLLANDHDRDSSPIMIAAVGGASVGTVALVSDSVRFTPPADFAGTATFTYTASAGGQAAQASVTVTVANVNDAPVAAADAAAAAEDTVATISFAELLANDTDVDGDLLTVTRVVSSTNLTVVRGATAFTATPPANFSGPASFVYEISDGVALATTTVTVTVTAVNDPPVALADRVDGVEDQVLTISGATLTGNDTDLDGGALVVTAVTMAAGTAVVSGGMVQYTPPTNLAGEVAGTYTVSDGAATATGSLTIALAAVNDPPVANDDAVTVGEDSITTFAATTLRSNDLDPDTDLASVPLTNVTASASCAVVNRGYELEVTPAANYFGTCTLTYTLSDGQYSDTATITVTVTPSNDRPDAVDDAFTVGEDGTLTVTFSQLLANDTDLEGQPLRFLTTYNDTSVLIQRTATSLVLTFATGFTGVAGFDYEISDDGGGTDSDVAHVTVTVTPAACGNGVREGAEECDDGDGDDADGCTAGCQAAAPCHLADHAGADDTQLDATSGRCYVGFLEERPWYGALAACRAAGGELAVAADAVEHLRIDALLDDDVWLGVTDWADEGAWLAVGVAAAAPYLPWGAGESSGEDCATTSVAIAVRVSCAAARPYVCEIPVCGDGVVDAGEQCDDGNGVDADGCTRACLGGSRCGDRLLVGDEECDDGNQDDFDGCDRNCKLMAACDPSSYAGFAAASFDYVRGHCHLTSRTAATWTQARDTCAALPGGALAVAGDADEWEVVVDDVSDDTWLGLTDVAVEGEWLTVTGAPAFYLPWSGDAFTDPANDDCGAVYAGSLDLLDQPCSQALHFVCELE